MSISDAEVRDLLDRESIRTVLLKYAAAVDTPDIERFDEIFAPEVSAQFNVATVDGLEALKAHFQASIDAGDGQEDSHGLIWGRTMHFYGNMSIDVDGDQASSDTYLLTMIVTTASKAVIRANRYRDTWARRDKGWLITSRRQKTNWAIEADADLDPH
ncbi:nuclear transport factor 2 family protein [Mycobacterium sp. C31M]